MATWAFWLAPVASMQEAVAWLRQIESEEEDA
jgi:hypothetical protein